jgi:hypothetical protein
MRSHIVSGALVALAATAHARAAHAGNQIKAEVLCGTYVGGEIKDVVPNGKKPRLADPVACAMRIHGVDGVTYHANLHTVRYAIDPVTGKKAKVATAGKTSDVENANDLELVMTPSAADDNGEIAFQPCEDFDVIATVDAGDAVVFSKTIHVLQKCPKPKPMKAYFRCVASKEDDQFDLPDKHGRRLEVDAIHCYVASKDPRFTNGNVKVWGQTAFEAPHNDETTGHHLSEVRVGGPIDGEDEVASDVKFETDDWMTCNPRTQLTLHVDDLAGATLFAKTITLKQTCDD